MPNIMLTAQFQNAEFASREREQGLVHLRSLGTLVPEPAILTAEHAPNLIASIASSSVYTDEFLRRGRGFAHRRPLGCRL